MNELDLLVATILKVCGSLAGAVLSLIFLPPKTLAEFVTRCGFSVIAGILFSEPVREYLRWAPTLQMELASSALTAMLSWFVMGAVTRLITAIDWANLVNLIKAWRAK